MRSGPPVDPLPSDRLALSRVDHERAAHLRTDQPTLDALWIAPSTRVLRVHRGRCEVVGQELAWFTSSTVGEGERYFLGQHRGVSYFACAVDDESAIQSAATLREIGAVLPDLEVGLLVQAVALAQWHASHPRCARCGDPTEVVSAGYARRCSTCDVEHYPRTDPAVIVLVCDEQDRILLGRQAVWPQGRFSTFAGFVEPGESFESAVAREVHEEAGVHVTDVRYLGSQPWPFPASVMIAFVATTAHPEQARPDGSEIEQVRWFSREELADSLASGEVILPPSVSIARRMIEAWFGDALTGGEAWR